MRTYHVPETLVRWNQTLLAVYIQTAQAGATETVKKLRLHCISAQVFQQLSNTACEQYTALLPVERRYMLTET